MSHIKIEDGRLTIGNTVLQGVMHIDVKIRPMSEPEVTVKLLADTIEVDLKSAQLQLGGMLVTEGMVDVLERVLKQYRETQTFGQTERITT